MINTTGNTQVPNAIRLERLGAAILRYGLSIILLCVGMFKFTAYEAEGIKPFVKNSPFYPGPIV